MPVFFSANKVPYKQEGRKNLSPLYCKVDLGSITCCVVNVLVVQEYRTVVVAVERTVEL